MKKLIAGVFVLSLSLGSLTACTFDSTTSASSDVGRSVGGGWGATRGAADGALSGTQDFVDDTVDNAASGYNAGVGGLPGNPIGPVQTGGPDHH